LFWVRKTEDTKVTITEERVSATMASSSVNPAL